MTAAPTGSVRAGEPGPPRQPIEPDRPRERGSSGEPDPPVEPDVPAGTMGAAMPPAAVVEGADGRVRCRWAAAGAPEYLEYHDEEWGRPLHGDDALYERLCLEAFQSGLSWLTILRKRPAFRRAFDGFVIERVATFGDDDIERLLGDASIVRNRAKIKSSINNARVAAELDIGLDELLWSFAPATPRPRPVTMADFVAMTVESTAMAKELKRRGFTFFGPTTAYALMQATGMVDDHVVGCWLAG